jgi:hypothetical protein
MEAIVTQRIRSPPTSTALFSSGRIRALSPWEPHTSRNTLWRRKLIAKVVTSIAAGEAVRSGRTAVSVARAKAATVTNSTTMETASGRSLVRKSA